VDLTAGYWQNNKKVDQKLQKFASWELYQ
jgi:hypothetical protein